MLLVDLTLPSPEENLALDEALLEACGHAAGPQNGPGEILRFWESETHFVALGVSCRLVDDVRLDACRRDGVPVLRRASGGGTVLQGPGCLNFSLALSLRRRSELRNLRLSYTRILGRILDALGLKDAAVRGTSDMAVGDRKFSGNAQKRSRDVLLHHGTILHGLNGSLVTRYLREPAKQPRYRARRSHAAFLEGLSLRPAEIKSRIAGAWGAERQPWTPPALGSLIRTKYGNPEWTRRF